MGKDEIKSYLRIWFLNMIKKNIFVGDLNFNVIGIL